MIFLGGDFLASTVLGIRHLSGEYQGRHYDNFVLHCCEEGAGEGWSKGSRMVFTEKVPAQVFYTANAVDQILPGHDYYIPHDRYGRPVDVQLVK